MYYKSHLCRTDIVLSIMPMDLHTSVLAVSTLESLLSCSATDDLLMRKNSARTFSEDMDLSRTMAARDSTARDGPSSLVWLRLKRFRSAPCIS